MRKAFLDLDKNHDGSISAEELAKILKYGVKQQDPNKQELDLDYSLLEYLVKLRCKQDHTTISYAKFCTWLGTSIEPTEAFYFRHDSQKNPQYDLNMQKAVGPILKTQEGLRGLLTGDAQTFKEKFLNKVKLQYRTLKKCFYELDRQHKGHVTLDQFDEIINSWGFAAKEKDVRDVFNWLDFDKDQKISFLDLKNTIGFELMPQEQFFFR